MERFIVVVSSLLFTITSILLVLVIVNQTGPTYVVKNHATINETVLEEKVYDSFIPLVDAREKESEEEAPLNVDNEIEDLGQALEDFPIYELPNDDGISIDDLLELLDLDTASTTS